MISFGLRLTLVQTWSPLRSSRTPSLQSFCEEFSQLASDAEAAVSELTVAEALASALAPLNSLGEVDPRIQT